MFGLGIPGLGIAQHGVTGFNPAALFDPANEGFWTDPATRSTLAQDSVGTTPVTAVAQPVGRATDRSGKGRHALQTTAGKRPLYARVPVGGRRNLLTYTEDFGNAAWVAFPSMGARVAAADPDGGMNATTLTNNATDGSVYQSSGTGAVGAGKFEVTVKAGTSSTFRFEDTVSGNGAYVDFNLSAVTAGSPVTAGAGGSTITTPVITDIGGGWRTCSMVVTRSGIGSNFILRIIGASGSSMTFWRASSQFNATAGAYQKVTSQYDVTEAGQADCWGLFYDGVNDAMSVTLPANLAVGAADVANVANFPASGTINGITMTKVGTGTYPDGTPYVDCNYAGVAAGASNSTAYTSTPSRQPAVQNDVFSAAIFAEQIAGTMTGVNGVFVAINEENAGNAFLVNSASPTIAAPTRAETKFSRTLTNPLTAKARVSVGLSFTNGATIDVTYRFSALRFIEGPGYTVATADDAGVTILTGQVLSDEYILPAPARLYGAVVIDRNLTAPETASVTAALQARRP